MPHFFSIYKFIFTLLITLLLVACGNDSADKNAAQANEPGDIVARVGDEVITFSRLSSVLNSSAMSRLSVPAPGTPERRQVILTLLDEVISANLVYLDAKKKGSDELLSYTENIKRFEDRLLASMYATNVMIGDIPVGEVDVIHYYNMETNKDVELTDEVKLAIETRIRQQKLETLQSTLRERLRENMEVVINEKVLSPAYDDKRTDEDTVATYDKQSVSWRQVKELMQVPDQHSTLPATSIDSYETRLDRLEQYIDNTIMTQKGREFGLEKDPVYLDRMAEYRKAYLVNQHSNTLMQSWNPTPEELKNFYVSNMEKIVIPAARKVQRIVLKTKEEAESIKAKIDAGEITMSQAVQHHSIDPDAERTQGDMSWVKQGAGGEGLDQLIFNLEPEVVGGPVESPAGWQLVKVLDVRDVQFESYDDVLTQNRTLMSYMQGKFIDYIADLRKNHFKVVIYDDELNRQLQKEADEFAQLNNKAEHKAEVTEQHDEKSHQWMVKPVTE
jgi:uncharacterized protein YacL (UPF0231 family)